MIEVPKRFGPLAVAVVLLALGAVLFVDTFRDDYHLSRASHAMGPAFFPRVVLIAFGLLGVLTVVETLRSPGGRVRLDGLGRVLGLIAASIAYGAAISWIGFVLSSAVFVVACAAVLGFRRWAIIVPVAILYAFAVWYLFEKVLKIILPASPWFGF